jgi:hypothetical protein
MLAVARAELAPEPPEPLAPRGVEKVVPVFGDVEQLAARGLDLAYAGRLGGGDVCAHALAHVKTLGELGQVFQRARAEREGLRRAAERLGDARQPFFERELPAEHRFERGGGATEALSHLGLRAPHALRQTAVWQRVELLSQPAPAPLVEPHGQSIAHLFARARRAGRAERRLARQQTRPLD